MVRCDEVASVRWGRSIVFVMCVGQPLLARYKGGSVEEKDGTVKLL